METVTHMAVFLDYAKARFIHFDKGEARFTDVVISDLHKRERIEGEGSDNTRFSANPCQGSNNEFNKNRDAENRQRAYLNKVLGALQAYQHILLFGPGQAKAQIYKLIQSNKHFDTKTVRVEPCDYKTDNQLLEFVRKHFTEN